MLCLIFASHKVCTTMNKLHLDQAFGVHYSDDHQLILSSLFNFPISIDGKLPICLKFPENAVSVVGVPESPEVAKNHGVLVGKQFGDYNSIASHYLQKPDMNQMQEVGAIFKNGSCNGKDAVYIDTGVVVFTGLAVNSFLSLLDNPLINNCTSKGLVDKGFSPIETQSSSTTVVAAFRLELYSDILHACALHDAPNDLETYLTVLGVTSTSASSKNVPYVSALKVIWNVLHSCPLHLIQVPRGMFCHLGTSSELLSLLSSCTDYVTDVEDESVNDMEADHEIEEDRRGNNKRQFSINTDSTDSNQNKDEINKVNIDKFYIFSKKYSLNNFVRSSILYQKDLEPYVTTHSLNSTDISFTEDLQGIIINSIIILENVTSHENGSSSASKNSLIEHSILSGIFNVGFRSIISHFPGFLGSNLTVLDDMMMQYVPLKYGDVVDNKSDENEFLVLVFSIDDDIKSYYLEEHSTICGVSWNVLFDVSKQNFCI